MSETSIHNPKLSVIVPTLNSAGSIARCLESLEHQSWKNFELLIQDGASTDETLSIVKNYQKSPSSFRIVAAQERDAGIYDAMNRALARAKGEWVLFLGSDDEIFDSETLARTANYLCSDVDVIYGDVVAAHISDRSDHRYAGRFTTSMIFEKNICHQAIFFRRELFDRIGKFDLHFPVLADWEHNLRWFLSPDVRVQYVDLVISKFAPGGLSSRCADSAFDLRKPMLYLVYGKHCISTRTKLRLIRRELLEAARRLDLWRLCRALQSSLAIFARFRSVTR